MPTEPLAVVGRGEELVNVVVERMRVGIAGHPRDICGKSRQTGENLRRTPNERLTGGFGCRPEPRRLEPREHEAVNVACAPGGVLHGGRGRDPRRVPAPVFRLALHDVEGLDAGLCGGDWLAVVRPRQPAADPFLDRLNRRRRQFPVGRHLEIAVVADHLHEQALVGLAGNSHALGSEKIGAGVE